MKPFEVIHRDATAHGGLVGVALPAGAEPVPEAVLRRLHPGEQDLARRLHGFRQPAFVGGRLAARHAMQVIGARPTPVLVGPRGEPTAEGGLSVSISHTRDLAVALVGRLRFGHLGVDVERIDRPDRRAEIAARVLTEDELAAVEALAQERRWTAVLLAFSVKEAIYKALAPRLQRYIAFHEVAVTPDPDGSVAVDLRLDPPAAVSVEARIAWWPEHLVATARARFS